MSNVLYLDTDEDITSAVEKLKASEGSDVQVVVPKRSTLLSSMINLKLLKKAADEHKKNLVLVTTDRLSTHLAGRVGLPVAAKLGAQANVPEANVKEPEASDVIDGGTEETGKSEDTAALAAVGAAAAGAKAVKAAGDDKGEAEGAGDDKGEAEGAGDDEMSLPNEKPADSEKAAATAAPAVTTKAVGDSKEKPKAKAKKGTHIPDFNAMQKKVLWAGIAVAVVVGLFILNFLMASAKVTIFAKGSNVPATATFTADPAATSSDVPGGVLKAQALTSSKDLSSQVAATGSKDVGTKAGGTMTINNSYDSVARSLPAGTRFTAQGKTFLSNQAVTVPGAGVSGGHVVPGSASVSVTAETAGDGYNLAPTSYVVGGQPSQVTGSGGQMSGGTSKKVKVVQQSDIDGAVAEMLSKDKEGGQKELADRAESGSVMINETFVQTPSNITPDTPVGSEADNVTVKMTAKYDALAVSKSDLDAVLKADIAKQVGPENEVYDTGASGAKFTVDKKTANGGMQITVASTGSAGPKFDEDQIAKDIAGKKYGDANEHLTNMKGVDHAVINISPSWNTRMPRRAGKINVQVKVAESNG